MRDPQGKAASDDQPLFTISVAAQMLDVSPQKLRIIESEGLIAPRRTAGKTRLYSRSDIERMRLILRLMDDLGINLAGVEVVLNMRENMKRIQREMLLLMKEFINHLENEGALESRALIPKTRGMLLRMTQHIRRSSEDEFI